jgi:Holliday junction resolvase RusA-like endonuclease
MAGKSYSFVIPGEPVAKGRPRFVRAGKFVRTYTPDKSARFEQLVKLEAQNAGVELIEGPVSIHVIAKWPMKGQPRKKNPRPGEWKTTRPDLDNLLKAVLDGLNGVAFADDAQVVRAVVEKHHASQGQAAQTIIEIEEAGE